MAQTRRFSAKNSYKMKRKFYLPKKFNEIQENETDMYINLLVLFLIKKFSTSKVHCAAGPLALLFATFLLTKQQQKKCY